MKSGGGSMASIGLHVGEDWWTFLSTYEDHGPILDFAAGSATVTVCFDGSRITATAVEFARELAEKAARFAAEAERLHARDSHDKEACTACQSRGDGEAA
jgi:hypothetical protein